MSATLHPACFLNPGLRLMPATPLLGERGTAGSLEEAVLHMGSQLSPSPSHPRQGKCDWEPPPKTLGAGAAWVEETALLTLLGVAVSALTPGPGAGDQAPRDRRPGGLVKGGPIPTALSRAWSPASPDTHTTVHITLS